MNNASHQLSLRLIQKCPSCQASVSTANVNILDETDDALFAHLSCPNCRVNYLTYIAANPQGLIGNAILTDMDYPETVRSLQNSTMNENDFLEIYRSIAKNQFLHSVALSFNHGKK